jgi:TetR/AcrR family transcriptional regulator, repressor for uid operon
VPRKKNDPRLRDERRAQIIAGARRCFAERGFHGAGVEDLERACELTRGTLFRYFPSKAAMLIAVIRAEAERRDRAFEETLAAVRGRPFGEICAALAQRQIRLSREDPWGIRLRLEVASLAERNAGLRAAVTRLETAQRAWRRALLRGLLGDGPDRRDQDLDAATDVLSALFLGLSVHCAYGFPGGVDDAALARGVSDLLSSGLVRRVAAQKTKAADAAFVA